MTLRGYWRASRLGLMGLGLLLLSGCGFHLRGSVELPAALESLYIAGTPSDGELAVAIEIALASNGGQRAADRETATAVLAIEDERFTRRVLSVDSSGKALEYELNYRLAYTLYSVEGKELVAYQRIEQQRDYLYDAGNVLGMSDEEQALRETMRRSGVNRMLQRLRRSLVNATESGAEANPS